MCDCGTFCKQKRVLTSYTLTQEWNYTDQEEWKTYKDYYNVMRNPININTNKTSCHKNKLKIVYSSNQSCLSIVNDKFVEYDMNDASSYVLYENNKYILKQFHFHNSSENTIDGKYYPIECHFVNEYIDQNEMSHLLMCCLMISIGKNGSQITSNIIGNIGSNVVFDLSVYNNITKHKYYNFIGSLSAPPFTPNIMFNIFDHDSTKFHIEQKDYDDYLVDFSNNKANILSYYNQNREVDVKNNFLAVKTIYNKK